MKYPDGIALATAAQIKVMAEYRPALPPKIAAYPQLKNNIKAKVICSSMLDQQVLE
ncbi:hypothetical protein ACFOWX_02280 [Sphingorhabdus arenilitoris]|uniref:Uncharacterized protein n=1 Tax=Sphingorhabdus arenilitoris TaxID=1490041 RepID=A0ABV8RFL3_9SPHN